MSNATRIAASAFAQNRNAVGQITDRSTPKEIEQYNLYNGLACLAEALNQIEYEIQQLKREVDQIRNR